MQPVGIRHCETFNSAGSNLAETWKRLSEKRSALTLRDGIATGRVPSIIEAELQSITSLGQRYDRAVRMALLCSKKLADAVEIGQQSGVVLASSRGTTHKIEEQLIRFQSGKKVSAYASPMSTSGIFASSVSQSLGLQGAHFFMSSACTSSLQSVGVTAHLVQSGLFPSAIAGGSESSLTPFTLAQLKSSGIYGHVDSDLFPLQPWSEKRNGTIPGEGVALAYLTSDLQDCFAAVTGFGSCSEKSGATGITSEGDALKSAVKMALASAELAAEDIDLVVGHGAGTLKGDAAEMQALAQALPDTPVTLHKWLTGHLLGAAGGLSVCLAVKHLETGIVPPLPYAATAKPYESGGKLQHILITGLGFGGGAVCLVVSRIG